jgi:hypothetical protein
MRATVLMEARAVITFKTAAMAILSTAPLRPNLQPAKSAIALTRTRAVDLHVFDLAVVGLGRHA